MTVQTPGGIRVAHGVIWHAGGIPEPSRLLIGSDSLRLTTVDDEFIAELAFDDLAAIRLPLAAKGRHVIVLESRQGEWIELESAAEQPILPDVLDKATSHLLADSPTHGLLLVSIRLRPGGRQPAVELLSRDPSISKITSSLTDVFVLADELVLLFRTGTRSPRTRQLWDLLSRSAENVVAIDIAEHAYSAFKAHEGRHRK